MIGPNTHVTPVQEDKVEEIVQDINSDIPILVAIMCKSHVNRNKCNLDIHKKYADAYLSPEKQEVVLQCHGKRWKMWLNVGASDDSP